MIKVMIVDDHPFTAIGIRDFLADDPEIEVVDIATRGDEALAKIASMQPEVVVLDYKLPGMDGSEIAAEIKRQGWPVRVLAFSAYDTYEIVHEMLEAGVQGYLLKTGMLHELELAIRSVMQGNRWFSQEVWTLLAQGENSPIHTLLKDDEDEEEEKEKLTEKQKEILLRIAMGKTDAQIAAELGVTTKAINAQLGRILKRLDADNRAHAVYLATKQGWI